MEVYDVVGKLIGPIRPLGESHTDEERFENLKAMTELVDLLLNDICAVGQYKNQHQASLKKAGKFADEFYDSIGNFEI